MGNEYTMKVVGRRGIGNRNLESAAGFLELVVALRGIKPFIPKGVHRLKTFEESQEWSLKMLTKPRKKTDPQMNTNDH